MIITGSILHSALEKYKHSQRKTKEEYKTFKNVASGINSAAFGFLLVISLLFFMMELILVFYAISIAVVCTKPGAERIINIVLSITFTIPYVMLNILFNDCAKEKLRSGKFLITST